MDTYVLLKTLYKLAMPPASLALALALLGGGLAPAMPPERDFPRLVNGADRVWLSARLYHKKVAPRVIVSGGGYMSDPENPASTEAAGMRQFLVDLGVPAEAIVDEGKSINTIENTRNVRAVVGNGRVALITSTYHMPRALHLAALAKLDVAAFPTDFRSLRETRPLWENWTFSGDALELSAIALREIIAIKLDIRANMLVAGALGE